MTKNNNRLERVKIKRSDRNIFISSNLEKTLYEHEFTVGSSPSREKL